MKRLTEKQQQILKFVMEFENTEGMAPTVYELADYFGVKTSTIFAHLLALQRKGKISRTSKARSLKIIGAYQTIKSRTEPEKRFVFQIPDDSMSDFGIYSGDVVFAATDQDPGPGDFVVIIADNETIMRSFYPAPNGNIELRPANSVYKSQFCNQRDVNIRGVVTALQRKYLSNGAVRQIP